MEELGNICMVRKVALTVYSVTLSCAGPPAPAPPANFWSVIESRGNMWLWENVTIGGRYCGLANQSQITPWLQ
jgi:hypothetical protein